MLSERAAIINESTASLASEDVFLVKMRVRASLCTGKSTIHLSNKSENADSVHSYDFHIGAWMGAENPHMDFQMLKGCPDGTGESLLTLPVLKKDRDTFKIGAFIRDPETCMMRHICSGFQSLSWLADGLENVTDFSSVKQSMIVKDNYSKNQALLHFCNAGTDVTGLRALCNGLSPSVLHLNKEINECVSSMTLGLHNWIESSANVVTLNGGNNFLNSMCYCEGMDQAINYPLLNMTYNSERHRPPLSMLAYMAIATLHNVGIPPNKLLSMPESEFVHKFAVPMCTSFTVCPKTSIYSGDKTIDACGNLDAATEDFAMVLSSHFYSYIKDFYEDKYGSTLGAMSDLELNNHINQVRATKNLLSEAFPTIADDCETL